MGLRRAAGIFYPSLLCSDPGYANVAGNDLTLWAGTSHGLGVGYAGFWVDDDPYSGTTRQLTVRAYWRKTGTSSGTFSLLQSNVSLASTDLRISPLDESGTSWGIQWFISGTQFLTKDLLAGGIATDCLIRLSDFGTQIDDVVVADATQSWSFDWSSSAQLTNWVSETTPPVVLVISSQRLIYGTGVQNYYAIRRFRWAVPVTPAISYLQAPVGRPLWFYKSVPTQITEQVGATGGASAILTGSSYGLCHAWMTDQGHRALVYEHSGNLSAALWDGDWQPMLVQAARTKPWAIRLEPSNDVWIPCIDTSNNLKLDRLVWDGAVSTYSVSTTELDTGIDAKDVGGMWIEPNGEVGLAYVNMSDQLAIATGDLSGGSWVL